MIQQELDALVTAGVELALNASINQQPDSQIALRQLKGKVLCLHLKEIDKRLVFVFSQQVDVLARYEGEPDCAMAVSLSTLTLLKDKTQLMQLIKTEQLALEGDLDVAKGFAELLSKAKPDIEEWLSRYSGDIVAHTLVSGFKQMAKSVGHRANKSRRHVALALTEEWQVSPPALEIAYFCDQVSELASHTSAVEARINALMDKSEGAQ